MAQGIASDPEAAHAEAIQRFGDVRPENGNWARSQWHKQQAIRRQQASAKGQTAQALEFAYNCHIDFSDYDNSRQLSITPHLIVRKTKTRIYVDDKPYRPNVQPTGEWYDYHCRTFVLDRQEWERTGKAERSGRSYWNDYYRDPELFRAECGQASRPACLEALDLPRDATADQIKARFRRLSRSMHPDAGGDEKAFVALRRHYEEALCLRAGR
jgi:hypothetical protein